MENTKNYSAVLEQLKRIVRSKGWNYSRLARALKVSEPTIKRIFAGAPCSMQRIMEICDALGISFFDVAQIASEAGPTKTYLTKEQDRFFAAHFDVYAFFFTLYYELEGPLPKLREKWGINDAELTYYVRKLEELDLVEVLPGGRIKFKIVGQINVEPETSRIFDADFLLREAFEFIQHASKRRTVKDTYYGLAEFQLSRKNWELFTSEVREVAEKYFTKSARDEHLVPEKDRCFYRTVFAMAPYRMNLRKYFDEGRGKATNQRSTK